MHARLDLDARKRSFWPQQGQRKRRNCSSSGALNRIQRHKPTPVILAAATNKTANSIFKLTSSSLVQSYKQSQSLYTHVIKGRLVHHEFLIGSR